MGLTPEEEAELRQLKAEEARERAREEGDQAVVRTRSAAQRTKPQKARPFSFYRATVGILKDVSQDLLDTSADVAASIRRNINTIGTSPLAVPAAALTAAQATISNAFGGPDGRVELPALKGEENAGIAERITRGIGSFLVPYGFVAKGVGVARGASWLGRAGKAMLAGGVVDFTKNPVDNNLANVIRDTFGIQNDVLNALASEEDDEALFARFKAATVNAPVGLAADAVFESGFRLIKAYRAWKGGLTEADAAVKTAKANMALSKKARDLVPAEPKPGTQAGDEAGGALVRPTEKSEAGADAGAAGPKEGEAFNPEIHASTVKEPKSFEDVLTFLKEKSGLEVDDDMLARLAANLLDGNPENALAKLGIDPAKLDFSLYDDPDLLGRLQKGLAEVYETIAQRLGRSNTRVSEAEIVAGARAFATTADVLKDLYGNTTNLAETLMGARLFVGAHAHKLLSLADKAAVAISTGAADKEAAWAAFMEAFHRHAFYLGNLRGAGSEVGRALKSLQMTAKVGKQNAARNLAQALKDEGSAKAAPTSFEEGASTYLSELLTDADRLLAIDKLRRLDGDVGDLSRHVRARNLSGLTRLDMALRETVGNLFSTATAVWNIAAGGSMMGLRVLGKGLLAIEKMALSPLGKNYSQEARVQLMDTWAYVDGIMSGFRDSYGHTLALLEREGMAEIAINLDTMGLKKLATKAATLAIEGSKKIGDNFERADVINDRWFAMRPSERRRLKELIAKTDAPGLLQSGLRGLVNAGAAAINAAGTMSRAGTILFINAPDQLVGTLAARAGAQAQAVRIAAQEAAELGLEGKPLTDYLKARAIQLTSEVDGYADDAFEAGKREAAHAHGEAEAREVLFQDDLEIGINRAITRSLSSAPFFHLIVPFIKTPLRILERTALDYTPLGLLKDRVRRAVLAGGPEGEEALTRIALGLMMSATAMSLVENRTIVGSDGSYKSSARLSRPSYSLRIGDDEIEFSRVDPVGTILGWAADIKAYYDNNEDDPQAAEGAQALFEAMMWATSANILAKSWLTSLRNLVDLTGATSDEDMTTRTRKFVNSFAARIMPASGIQRGAVKAGEFVPEASSFMDALTAASIGAPTLPTKRDPLLGRPVPVEGWNRLLGIKAGPGASPLEDPLLDELENLSFDIPAAKRTVEGVRLTAAQFSRWLALKGQEVRNENTGLTLEETLTALIKLPEYRELNRAGRVDAMRVEMEDFSRLATDQLIREDKQFARDVLQKETWDALELQGATKSQKETETARLARELGLGQ